MTHYSAKLMHGVLRNAGAHYRPAFRSEILEHVASAIRTSGGEIKRAASSLRVAQYELRRLIEAVPELRREQEAARATAREDAP